ncbi:MAG: leucine-rich repeat protein, partial [Clostridia bacterium]|nr:leucine-rich repeat protein [Clostridia bacterium]
LSSITMPSSLESIADYAFSQSALTVSCPANSYAHTWAVSKGYTVQPICAAHAVVLAQNLYETTQGEAIDIPFTLSCAGACGMDVYWADDAQRSDTANGSISYPADVCGARTIRLWLDGEQDKAVSCRVIVHAEQQMILPGDLTVLGEEAFAGMAAAEILLPEGMSVIGPRAFANCADLVLITIPDSVTLIADDAFEGSANVTILCADGSYAAEYADQMQIAYIAR